MPFRKTNPNKKNTSDMCFKTLFVILSINITWHFIDYYFNIDEPLLNSIVLSVLYFVPITYFVIRFLFSKEIARATFVYDAIKDIAIVLEMDADGKIKYVNSKFIELSSYSMLELIGQNYRLLSAQENSPNTFKEMMQSFKKHNHWRGDIISRKKSGDLYTLNSTVIPVIKNNKINGFMLLAKDITQEKTLTHELEMEKSKNMHRSRLESLGKMSAGLAHEMNNPLMIVSGNLALIKKNIDTNDAKLGSRFSAAEKGLDRISEILLGLKKFSRTNTSNKNMNIDIEKLIKESISLIKLNPKAKGIKIDFDFSSPQSISVLGNECSLEQVFINLLNNSIDAISLLDEKWIKISLNWTFDFLYIRVVDSGKGISSELKHKLFEPFFTTKEVGKATGLGLSIVRGIIEDHYGEIKIDSLSPNTCFTINLPINTGVNHEKN